MPTVAPQINITLGVTRSPRARPSANGAAMVVGVSRTGPVGIVTRAQKLNDHAGWLGGFGGGSADEGRLTHSSDHDGVEEYFQDGGAGAGLYYSRVVGPGATKAALNIPGTSGAGLVVTFDEFGDLPQERRLKVINGPVGGSGFRVLQLLEADGTTVVDQTIEYSANVTVNGVKLDVGGETPLTIALGGGTGLTPVMSATAPTGGTDDHANITITQITQALSYLDVSLGNGNVAAPNWGTPQVGTALLNHAFIFNRFAAIDTVDTTVKATVLTQANSLQGLPNGEHGTLLTPWVEIPPLTADGQPRAIPGSWLQLAKWAETDATDGPNQAAAGKWGTSSYATGVRATYSASDRDDLANAGVTVIRLENDEVKVFDNLTLVEPDGNEKDLLQNQNIRYLKNLVWQFTYDASDEHFGKVTRDALAAWKVRMEGRLLRDFKDGDLYPDDDDPRFATAAYVNTGGSKLTGPNSAATINAGEKNAQVGVRPAKGGRIINLAISLAGLTTPVA